MATTGHQAPTGYRLTVAGQLDDHWARWFGDLTLTHEPDGTTSLCGDVRDQAELHGLLTKVRDLGIILVAVQVIEATPSAGEVAGASADRPAADGPGAAAQDHLG